MKTLLISIPMIALCMIGCSKKSEGNAAVIKQETPVIVDTIKPETQFDLTNTEKEITYAFKASNGNRATATLKNTEKEHTIVILANRNMFQLDRKEFTKYGAIYERNGVQVEIKKDSLFITQDSLQIDLVYDK
mgnify:FL=1